MASPTPARPPGQLDDWAAQAAGRIEGVVDGVRSKTTGPLTTIARAIVFGTLAAVLAVMAIVAMTIGSVRALDTALPGEVWSAYLLMGSILTLAGLFLWTKRVGKTK